VDQLFPQVGLSSLKVLRKLGVDVDFDQRQTCCGQPAYNTGYQDESRDVVRHFLQIYEGSTDPIVIPSGSCTTMIKRFAPDMFDIGSKERTAAEEIAGRCWEFSDFLVSVLGIEGTGARFPEIVTYHDSCHLLRELRISEQPRQLIRSVDGIDFREMDESDQCCGFGGTFSVKYPEISVAMLEDKVQSIKRTRARYVIGNDVSCLMHISSLMQRQGSPVQIMHLAELLSQFDDSP
jgi:L-lactate dehydrogenase complex protein LldE